MNGSWSVTKGSQELAAVRQFKRSSPLSYSDAESDMNNSLAAYIASAFIFLPKPVIFAMRVTADAALASVISPVGENTWAVKPPRV